MLARTAMTLNNPAEALNALTLIPAGAQPADAQTITDMRVTLLLWLNRLDEAAALDGTVAAWLDALDHAVTAPHAQAIADALAERFDELSEPDAARLTALRQRLADAAQPPTEDG